MKLKHIKENIYFKIKYMISYVWMSVEHYYLTTLNTVSIWISMYIMIATFKIQQIEFFFINIVYEYDYECINTFTDISVK
jgi:hypothetical protein